MALFVFEELAKMLEKAAEDRVGLREMPQWRCLLTVLPFCLSKKERCERAKSGDEKREERTEKTEKCEERETGVSTGG